MSDEDGEPIATEVFQGNTLDFATLGVQVKKITEVFGCQEVTVVGDRGMRKSDQLKALKQAGFHYTTALTKAQIRALLQRRVLHLEAFGEQVREVTQAGIRYGLRRNSACSEAPAGHARWMVRLLADKAVELEIVDRIAPETIRQFLKKTNCRAPCLRP